MGSEALQKLQRGELSLSEYLDSRIEAALARLGRLVTEEERELLREVLREEAVLDPVVQEYLRRATGQEIPFPVHEIPRPDRTP